MKRGAEILLYDGGNIYRATVIAMRLKSNEIQVVAPRGNRRAFRFQRTVSFDDYGRTWVRPSDQVGAAALESIARLSRW